MFELLSAESRRAAPGTDRLTPQQNLDVSGFEFLSPDGGSVLVASLALVISIYVAVRQHRDAGRANLTAERESQDQVVLANHGLEPAREFSAKATGEQHVEGFGLFSDDPLDSDADDALDRGGYAAHVADVIRRVRTQGAKSSVLAIVGPWGSGKSTVLGMVKRRLDESGDDWIIADFTPWLYPDADTMQAAFFRELNLAIPKEGKWKSTGETIENLGAAISPLGKFTTLLGVDSSEVIKSVSKTISGDTSVNATKKKAEAALAERGQPILVIIDDLDRLSPDELLMVFKLVRFVGRLPNVYYLLSYDERTLIDVIKRTDLAADKDRRAQDYMEKMVQVRLDLPALRDSQAENLINEAMASILIRNNVELDEDQVRRITLADESMSGRLNTPRSIRRFFAQVDAFYRPGLAGEIDFVDFLCLTWIRTFEPQAYHFIHRNRRLLTKSRAPSERRDQEERDYWIGLLRKANVTDDNVEDVLTLIQMLFPPAFSPQNYMQSPSTNQGLHLRRRVSHPDYFDRYFAFAVPSEDIPDYLVQQGLDPAHDNHREALKELAPQFLNNTARVSRKIHPLLDKRSIPPRFLLAFICAYLEQIPEGGSIFQNPRMNVELLARDALLQIPESEARGVLEELAKSPAAVSLFAWEVVRLTQPSSDAVSDRASNFGWAEIAIDVMSARISELLHGGDWSRPDEVPSRIFRLIYPWRFLDPEKCRTFMDQQIPLWGLLPTLMRMVPESILYGDGAPVSKLEKLSMDHLAPFVSVDRALDELAPEIAELPADSDVSGQWRIEPTNENRRAIVLEALRNEMDRAEARRRSEGAGDEPIS